MVTQVRNGWINPLAGLAMSRCERSRGMIAWALAPLLVAGPAAFLFSARPPFLTPVLQAILMGRLSEPSPGELFALPILLIAFLMLTVVGTVPRATLGVARERERRTLEPLLLTRMSRVAILGGVLFQAVLPPALAGLALLPLLCLSFSMGGISIACILASLAMLLLGHLFFATSCLGICSWCRRSSAAMVLGYSWMLLLCGGTALLWSRMRSPIGPGPWWLECVLALNPVAALSNTVMPWRGVVLGDQVVPLAIVSGGGYLLLGVLFFAMGVAGLRRR